MTDLSSFTAWITSYKHLQGQHDQATHGHGGSSLDIHPNLRTDFDTVLASYSPRRREAVLRQFESLRTVQEREDFALERVLNDYQDPLADFKTGLSIRGTQNPHIEDVRAQLNSIESGLIGRTDKEQGFGISSSGSLDFHTIGSSDTLQVRESEMEMLKGGIFTHNHPSSNSFSIEDISSAASGGLAEMRAVAANGRYIYSMTIPNLQFDKPAMQFITSAMQSVHSRVKISLWERINSGTITIEWANAHGWHEVWTEFSRQYPAFVYQRIEL